MKKFAKVIFANIQFLNVTDSLKKNIRTLEVGLGEITLRRNLNVWVDRNAR